jgi:S-adenosylmethionine-diacylgycerolhomoserine-N-methlytransferase
MGLTSDLRILYRLAFTRVRGASHADRLDAFYRNQADGYDDFRRRLLHGREEMMRSLDLPAGGRLLDMGGGTGSNLEAIADRLPQLGRVEIVDLCGPLLRVADERIARHGWTNVRTVEADATTYQPDGPVDAITFSYSLTMIPDWFRALDHAVRLLRPGGQIGVADFYVSRKWPADGMRRHSRSQRSFWPRWFAQDDVFLSPDHLPYLQTRFQQVKLIEGMGKVPYLLGWKAPYYVFLGRKRDE